MINLDCTLWKPKCCLVPLDVSDDEIPNMSMAGERLCNHLRSLKCWMFSSANSVILFFEPECQYSPLASTCWRSPSPLPCCATPAQASVLAASGSIPVPHRSRRRAVSWGPGNNKGVFSWWFFPSPLNISPPWCSQSMCAFSLLQSNKGNPDVSWEFSSQWFLKTHFFTYSICFFVTVNGKPSHVKFCVSLKGAAGPRGEPVRISSLSHLFPLSLFPLHSLNSFIYWGLFWSLFFYRDSQDKKERR